MVLVVSKPFPFPGINEFLLFLFIYRPFSLLHAMWIIIIKITIHMVCIIRVKA